MQPCKCSKQGRRMSNVRGLLPTTTLLGDFVEYPAKEQTRNGEEEEVRKRQTYNAFSSSTRGASFVPSHGIWSGVTRVPYVCSSNRRPERVFKSRSTLVAISETALGSRYAIVAFMNGASWSKGETDTGRLLSRTGKAGMEQSR